MADTFQERYIPVLMPVNSTYTFPSGSPTAVGGFLCAASGNITITKTNGSAVVSAFPMTAGVYYPMPFYIGHEAVVTLAGGAAGTLGVY